MLGLKIYFRISSGTYKCNFLFVSCLSDNENAPLDALRLTLVIVGP